MTDIIGLGDVRQTPGGKGVKVRSGLSPSTNIEGGRSRAAPFGWARARTQVNRN